MDKETNKEACEIINALGGTTATADIFEIAPSSVSEWRRTGVPKARLMFLKLARPEVFSRPDPILKDPVIGKSRPS